jgi:NADPH:quinone reductase-like Zn-dependent oxidoreductase
MKAIQFTRFGPPDVLELIDVPTPKATEGSALVQISAAAINPSDVKNVAGQMEGTVLPRIPGRNFAGVVVDGPDAWVGAEVFGTGGDIGFTRDGSHAEAILLPAEALVRKPTNLSFDQAASIGVNFVIAWLGAIEYGGLQSGETVVIIGAGGGVGDAVAQIAAAQGAIVFGVDRREPPQTAPAARVLSAYIPSNDGAPDEVRRLTKGKGADLVFDTVGGILFEVALSMAAHNGRVVEIASTGKQRVEFDLRDFYHNETRLIGADSRKRDATASARLLANLTDGFERGRYTAPIVNTRYPLARAKEAYAAVQRGSEGRIVLTP